MKAVQIDEFGGPEVLKVEEVKEPEPNENEVKVKLYAAGVNPADTYTISGNYGYNVPNLPYIPGNDGAGIIEKVGPNVKNVAVGDRVFLSSFGANRHTGTYAEKLVIDADRVFPLSYKMTFNEGAALGIPAFTAYHALFNKAGINAGEFIMVHGASGAVGSLAVQMAKAIGAIVIGTSSTQHGRDSILDMGADYAIPHVTEENKDELLKITEEKGPDVIIEFLANKNLETDTKVAADNGRIVIVGSRDVIEITPRNLMTNEAIVTGMAFTNPSTGDLHEAHHGISAFVENGTLKPMIGDVHSLDEASQAHKNVMETSGNGRTLLEIRPEE